MIWQSVTGFVSQFFEQINIAEERAASGLLADFWEFADERAGIKQYIAGLSRSEAEREAGGAGMYSREHLA